ncbi:MAG: hypothetical protein AAGI28_14665 [Pseudomonadota bacterium]
MSEASFASLGPTLLARKGGAKPAMRPQLAPLPDVASVADEKLEDLGWNDMGDTDDAPVPAKPKKAAAPKKPKAAKKAADKAADKGAGKPARRAAFTLRLDADRHLKLRLAATMHGMSAQALVTEALDTMFGEIEDLDALASRMQRN